ncbi:hypothetical protein K443DRAFT_94292 [Laccaria amethystina LaAM-08-1]|uniref:Arrestin-like N-terminal domain-containing protein n=1 Tax=Laccaria amethystina LaAM-08-1 TaxID=1095629 RepID=A0A0C9Y1E5_9AGAR|nr:hypothetical protein K443DRAFT_94292 [Laccaria amethystina LaAM-08-1]
MPPSSSSRRHTLTHGISTPNFLAELPPQYTVDTESPQNPVARRRLSHPPRYSNATALELQRQGSSSGQDSTCQHQHEFHIMNTNRSHAWTTLRIFSRNAGSTPQFFGRDFISGSVELDLEKPQKINSITLYLRGRIITSSLEEGSYTFLDHAVDIWNKDVGDPRAAHAGGKRFDEKLDGKYRWPFNFAFPSEFTIPSHGGQISHSFQTPQTFHERGLNATLEYELFLHINHGMFRGSSKLHVGVAYVPNITPAPSSPLRRRAYLEGVSLSGPGEDYAGWYSLHPVILQGEMSGRSGVEFRCILSLANPLTYTRGTVLPCFMNIEANDQKVLDTFANAKIIRVCLKRRISYTRNASLVLARFKANSRGKGSSLRQDEMTEIVEDVGQAVWWVPSNAAFYGPNVRCLEGEIHLPKNLYPSCMVPFLIVEYYVALSIDISDIFRFTSVGSHDSPIISQPVTIASFHGEGPLPVAFTAPPGKRASGLSSHRRAQSNTDVFPATLGPIRG